MKNILPRFFDKQNLNIYAVVYSANLIMLRRISLPDIMTVYGLTPQELKELGSPKKNLFHMTFIKK